MKFTDAEIEELAEKIRKMKEQGTHLCCSIGFLTEKQALMLKEAGLEPKHDRELEQQPCLLSQHLFHSHI